MPGRWMDEQERRWRDREEGERARLDEDRTWRGDQGGYRPARSWGGGGYGGRSSVGEGGYGPSPRIEPQDYTVVGPYYGDDRPARAPRDSHFHGDRDRAWEDDNPRRSRREATGSIGGYDYERGYGDGGRGERPGQAWDDDGRFEQRARSAGESLRRMGERVSSFLGGDRDHAEADDGARRYKTDFGREARWDVGHRGRGPKGYTRPDDRIIDDIHQRLTDDPWLDASQIHVAVSAGEVTLTGSVENRHGRRRAEDIVEDVSGVIHIQNDLRVGGGSFFTNPPAGFGDSALEAQMRDGGEASGGSTSGEDSAMSRTTTRRS